MEPAIRRVVAARTANAADVDDLVQDCLERLLAVHGRLTPEAVLPYAIVTARNLVTSHARSAVRRAAAAPRVIDLRAPDRPEDVVLAGEARRAMAMALGQLSPQERSDILTYYRDDPPPAGGRPEPTGALRVRMARTRAKLRLEYLLAFRRIELPTPHCRRVLLAISGGDTRRQRELSAGQHLLDCGTCAMLSEPLDRRSIALTAISLPGGLAAWAMAKAQAHPVQAAVSVAAGSAVVAGAAVAVPRILAASAAPAAHASPPSSPSAASPRPTASPSHPPVISHLSVAGRPVPDARVTRSIRAMIGESAAASGVRVDAVVTRNGFWIGTPTARVWVQLVGPLEPLRIRPGDRVRFTGTVAGNPPGDRHEPALLGRQGAYIAVKTTNIRVEHQR